LKNILLFLLILNCFLYSKEILLIQGISNKYISKYFYGVNILNFINYDNLSYFLKDLNIGSVVYPGGEIGDNYNWKLNKIYDINFLYSKFRKNKFLNFDSFMSNIKILNLKPIVVVNLEQGFIEKNITKYAKLAANWVYYANIIKKYNIKYWIIGNESYNLPTRYALSALDYAKAFKIYSREMKKVDPNIKIGAIGPVNFKAIAVIDTLKDFKIKKVRYLIKHHKRAQVRKMYNLFLYGDIRRAWWYNVLKLDKNFIDFIVLHYYYNSNDKKIKDNFYIHKNLSNMNFFIKKFLKKEVPIFITEFGFTHKISNILDDKQLSIIFTKILINFLVSKNVANISYWPFKYYAWKTSLLNYSDKKTFLYNLYKFFSNNLIGYLLKIKNNTNVLITGVLNNSSLKFIILNENINKKRLTIKLENKIFLNFKECKIFDFNKKGFPFLIKNSKIINKKLNVSINSKSYIFIKCK